MNKLFTKSLTVLAGIAALAGCNKDIDPATSGMITIEASVGPMTKVSYDGNNTTFTAGDQLSVYAWMGSADEVPATRVINGVVNTFDGSTWTPASMMRWRTTTDAHYFLGVSPVRTITDFKADSYTLDPADYTASDLLIAKNLAGLKSSDGAVLLQFDHAMAKLNVNLRFRNQWTTTPTVSSVTIKAKTNATIDYLAANAATATGAASEVVIPALASAVSGFAYSYSGLQVPQSGVKTVTVTIDGKAYVYESTDDIPLEAGKYTTLDLVVGRDKIELGSISVNPWVSGTPLAGGEATKKAVAYHLNIPYPDTNNPIKNKWEAGDVIYVFFSNRAAPRYLKMKYDGADWSYTEMNGMVGGAGCLGFQNGDAGTMRAVYLPFSGDVTVAEGTTPGTFTFSREQYSYYLVSNAPVAFTVANYELNASLTLKLPDDYVQFFVPNSSDIALSPDVVLREPRLTPRCLSSISADGNTVTTKELAHGAPIKGYAYQSGTTSGLLFSGALADAAQDVTTDYDFTLVDGGWDGTYYHHVQPGIKLLSNDDAHAVAISDINGWPECQYYLPLDLGCDVDDPVQGGKKRVYWACRNLGAKAVGPFNLTTVYGDLYAWGEVETYYNEGHAYEDHLDGWKDGKDSGYYWPSYSFDNSAAKDASSFSKYTGTDYDTLQAVDDVANTTLHGFWRIPTKEDWEALMNAANFDWVWESGPYGNSSCMIISSKDPEYSEVKMVLPPAGAWGMRFYNNLDVNDHHLASYWTSTLVPGARWGAYMMYYIGGEGAPVMTYSLRCYGYTIRPVTD